VLALELGAALAAVLVEVVGAGSPRTIDQGENAGTVKSEHSLAPRGEQMTKKSNGGVSNAAASSYRRDVSRHRAGVPQKAAGRRPGRTTTAVEKRPARGKTAAQIVDALRAAGGRVEQGSVRRIAGLIGGRKSTVHTALNVLLAGGVVAKAGRALVLA
jgi:hypothetical protein